MQKNRFGLFTATALIVLALVMSLTGVAYSVDPRVWGAGHEKEIRQGHHIEWQRASYRRAADGFTLVAWSDTRLGNRDVYAQLINPSGQLMWQDDGLPVCTVPVYRSEDPEVIAVNDGGTDYWIVAWIDFRNDTAGDVWAQKYNDVGVAQWAVNGIVVDQLSNSEVLETTLRLAPDGQGGAIVAWEDKRNDTGDILAQHLLASGTTAWAQPLAVAGATGEQSGITADADGQGNMVVAWNDKRNGANYDIYAAKVTPTGLTPWGTNGLTVCDATGDQAFVKLCPDGNGGCYIAWVDQRNGSQNDLYVQRVLAAGTVEFAANGALLCGAGDDQEGVRVATSWNGATADGVLATWQDLRANGLVKEVYTQKVSPTGTMLWAADGIKACGDANPDPENPTGTARQEPRLTTDMAGGMICAWEDARATDGATYDLYAVRVLANGTLSWGGLCGRLVSDGPGTQGEPLLRVDEGNGVFVFYADRRSGSLSVRIQNLDLATGALTLDPAGVEIVYGIDGLTRIPRAIATNNGRVAFVWEDNRSAYAALYYQIIDTDGNLYRAVNGDTLVPDNEGSNRQTQENFKLASDGTGGFFIAFEDMRTGRRRIRLQRVDAAGDIACTAASKMVFTDTLTTDQKEAYIAPDGQGGCYIAWSNLNRSYIPDVFVMRLDANCMPAAGWTEPVRLSNTALADEAALGLAADGQGCCVATWRFGPWGEYDLGGAKICGDGTVAWAHPLCDATGVQDYPVLLGDGSGGIYAVWEDSRTPARGVDIYAQRFDATGAQTWTADGLAVISDTLLQNRPQITCDAQGNLTVVWEDFRSGTSLDLFGKKMSSTGATLWGGEHGRAISAGSGDQKNCMLFTEWDNGMYAAWTDARSPLLPIYGFDVFGTHIKADSTMADPWCAEGIGGPLCDFQLPQSEPTFDNDGHGAVIAGWVDERASGKEPLKNIWCAWINDGTVDVSEIPTAAIPQSPELAQNYPNPFNPTTRIQFSLPAAQRVQVEVFNTLGQKVGTLVDRMMTAGRYEITFNAERLASGMYFYRLKTATFVDVKKMTLMR